MKQYYPVKMNDGNTVIVRRTIRKVRIDKRNGSYYWEFVDMNGKFYQKIMTEKEKIEYILANNF